MPVASQPTNKSVQAARIAIGTAQFGMDYGVANKSGQVITGEAQKILTYARSVGIDTLDTASAYGVSEERLGQFGVDAWKVVTKLPGLPIDIKSTDVEQWLHSTVNQSLKTLKLDALFAVLLHKPSDLFNQHGQSLFKHLLEAKKLGKVQKIGISVYTPKELEAFLRQYPIDLVQLPFNVFDQRFANSGWLAALNREEIEIHGRSSFLQGLLLMPANERPSQFQRWRDLWVKWDSWLKEIQMTPIEACLSAVLSQAEINRVVIGFDNLDQLQQTCETSVDLSIQVPEQLKTAPEELVNPSRWAKV